MMLVVTVFLSLMVGAMAQDCGEPLSGSGTFSSPNYPANYPNNAHCIWTITVPDDYSVELTFSSFELEGAQYIASTAHPLEMSTANPSLYNCDFDLFEVYDGVDTSAIIGAFCGTTMPDPIVSVSNSMTVEFTTDDSIVFSGFTANYRPIPSALPGPVVVERHVVERYIEDDCRIVLKNKDGCAMDSQGTCGAGCDMQIRTESYICGGEEFPCDTQCWDPTCPDPRDMTIEEVMAEALTDAGPGADFNDATVEVWAAPPSFVPGSTVIVVNINVTFHINDETVIVNDKRARVWICCENMPGAGLIPPVNIPCSPLMELMPCWLWRMACPWRLWPASCV